MSIANGKQTGDNTIQGTSFLSGHEDCQWLRDTALRGYDVPAFGSFVFTGNEDCPLEIGLYASDDPDYNDTQVASYVLVTDATNNLGRYMTLAEFRAADRTRFYRA